jgi:hypothetical protein
MAEAVSEQSVHHRHRELTGRSRGLLAQMVFDIADDWKASLADTRARFHNPPSDELKDTIMNINPYDEAAEKERRFTNRSLVATGFIVMFCSVGYAADVAAEKVQEVIPAIIAELKL